MIKQACKTNFRAFGRQMPSHAKCSFVFGRGCHAKGTSCSCKITRRGCKRYNKLGRRCIWTRSHSKCMCPMKRRRRRDDDVDDDHHGPPGGGPPDLYCDRDDDDEKDYEDDGKHGIRRHRRRRPCPSDWPSASPTPSDSPDSPDSPLPEPEPSTQVTLFGF